jgi:hypothetical protein
MIGALLWKEYREQRIAWAAIALVGAATVYGLPILVAPGRGIASDWQARGYVGAAVIFVAWAYGLICGAMLLAGEREMGTLAFLDVLPSFRAQLWRVKCLAGVLLVAGQIAVLMTLSAAAHLFDTWFWTAATLVAMAGAGFFGLGWGMLFSAFGRNVMNMILAALGGQLAASIFFLALATFLSGMVAMLLHLPGPIDIGLLWSALAAFSIPVALGASAYIFTKPDRGRMKPAPKAASSERTRTRDAWSRLWWLTARQSRFFAVGMAVFALVLGFIVLADGGILWPAATLFVGVLCGATAFADEQQGPFHFLGDQRLPLGRLWIVKVGLRFLIALIAAVIILLPTLAILLASMGTEGPNGPNSALLRILHTSLVGTVCPVDLFLTAWLVVGFCAGVLCGLLFHNGLASGVFSLFLATVLAGVWVPSMLRGGLHTWQVFGPPILLLLSTPFLMRPWAAGRVVSWTTTRRLAPFAALAILWTAAGLYYRVVEIPDAPTPKGVDAFRASLPTPEQNTAGELIRGACARYSDRVQFLWGQTRQAGVGEAGVLPGFNSRQQSLDYRIDQVIAHGWTHDDRELAAYLDGLFVGDWLQAWRDWVRPLEEAADLPPGMVADLRIETVDDADRAAVPAGWIGLVLTARGLQRQAAGHDEDFVENLRIGLALARSLRRHAPVQDVAVGSRIEGVLFEGLELWLEHLNGRPDLLRRALDLVSTYLDAAAADEADQPLVNYLIARNSVDDPLAWLPLYLTPHQPGGQNEAPVRDEAQLVAAIGQLIPWERERQERILRALFNGGPGRYPPEAVGRSPLSELYYLTLPPQPPERLQKLQEEVVRLATALRCFQAENGRPAKKLAELIPKYLSSIPLDPYDGRPLRYRLSAGEEIAWPPGYGEAMPAPPPKPIQRQLMNPDVALAPASPPPPPPTFRKVPPGQGILWSVGEDGADDGGHRQGGAGLVRNAPGEDLIFLVPLPPMR